MIMSVHQPQYIPWLGYFEKIDKSDCFVYLDKVQYKAREFQNRNKIRTGERSAWLTVPVVTKGLRYQKIRDVMIDNGSDWARQHERSLEVWYGNTPGFSDNMPFFKGLYSRKWERLIDLNVAVIEYMLEKFGIRTPVFFESDIGTGSESTDRIIELCRKKGADTYLSGAGGRDYLEEGKFGRAGIKLIYQEFGHPAYRQRDMKGEGDFMPYMSAVDLLFNEGARCGDILRRRQGA